MKQDIYTLALLIVFALGLYLGALIGMQTARRELLQDASEQEIGIGYEIESGKDLSLVSDYQR